MVLRRRLFSWLSHACQQIGEQHVQNVQYVVLGGSMQPVSKREQCSDAAIIRHALEHLSPSIARIARQRSELAYG